MKLMHTRLPDFYDKLKAAARRVNPETKVTITGMENTPTAKLASLRVGRIENSIYHLTMEDPDIETVEVSIHPYYPETAQTVVIKGVHKDGSCKKAYMEVVYVSVPAVEHVLAGVEEVVDNRPKATVDIPR